MKDSKIAWTHNTHNPWWGCVEVSPACDNCYAREMAHRWKRATWGKDEPRWFASDKYLRQPLVWDAAAAKAGERHRVFMASMADIFEDRRDLDGPRTAALLMAEQCKNLDWMLLTKRPQAINSLIPEHWQRNGCPPNIWLLTTVESAEYLWRADALLKVNALSGIYGISNEPALGSIITADLVRVMVAPVRRISFVITGGESGTGAREYDIDEARKLRDLCKAAGAAYFFKQAGKRPVSTTPFPILQDRAGANPDEWPIDLNVQELPRSVNIES